MGNAIRFGIYRIVLIISSLFIGSNTYCQDYYIDLQGDTQYVEITEWAFNHFRFQDGGREMAMFSDDILRVFRSQSDISYQAYSVLSEDKNYVDFFIPSIESVKRLSTDYIEDENFMVWSSGDYILYQVSGNNYSQAKDFEDSNYRSKIENAHLFQSEEEGAPIEIDKDVIFIYHDSVGFNKVVSDDIEDDYFRLTISKYTLSPTLNEELFDPEFKLKQKDFLEYFNKNISPLTDIQNNDKDLARYYISLLKDGALILLLNLDMKKIELYRNSGNEKLANELEEDLRLTNLSLAVGFLEPEMFNFCKVYVTDANNRAKILEGTKENIFLNSELELDSSIVLEEDFFLFVRKGQVYETQAVSQTNQKKKEVTSTPVVQDAIVVYDHNNIQLMSPFPTYVRRGSAAVPKNTSKDHKDGNEQSEESLNYKEFVNSLNDKYDVEELSKKELAMAYIMNINFYKFLENNKRYHKSIFNRLQWNKRNAYANGQWYQPDNMIVSPWNMIHKNLQHILVPTFNNF